jgi:S-adenosylmethionine/arginine decarboxylase-like enzyme
MKFSEILSEQQHKKAWGYHVMLDCAGLGDGITNKETIKEFLKELVERIDMEAVGEPILKYFPAKPDPKSGWTAVQLIVTSNITCHFMDQDRTGYIDVFSCKDFDPKEVEAVVEEYFNPSKIKSKFVTRDAS